MTTPTSPREEPFPCMCRCAHFEVYKELHSTNNHLSSYLPGKPSGQPVRTTERDKRTLLNNVDPEVAWKPKELDYQKLGIVRKPRRISGLEEKIRFRQC